MAHSLKLEVLLGAVDKATAPLNRISKATKEAAKIMRSTRKELRDLNKTQGDISAYQRAEAAVNSSAHALKLLKQQTDKVADAHAKAKTKQSDLKAEMTSAQRQFERIAKAMKNAGGHSATLSNELDKTRLQMDQIRKAQSKASEEVQKHSRRLRTLGEQEGRTRHQTDEARKTIEIVGRRLREAGHDMQHLGRESRALNQNEGRLNDTLRTQRERLERLRHEQERATAAREKFEQVRNGAAVGGAIGMAAGGAALYGGYQTIEEAKHFDLEKNRLASLGIGQDMTDRLTKYATEMQGFGTSQLERMELMRDAMSVLGDEHHAKEVMPLLAKMKFANKALYGDAQAGEMEKKFIDMLKVIELRGGLNSTEEFTKQANMIQRVITATGGRVDATEYMHVIQRGGLAAKGSEDEGFYYELEPIVQEMGGNAVGNAMMSGYNNLYQGKTTRAAAKQLAKLGLVGNKSAIQYDKTGQNAYLGPGALLNGELFRKNQIEWVRTVLIPQLKKNGITDEKGIQDAIGSIISNRTASNLYSTFVQQIGNGSIQRRMDINKNSEGIDQAEARARETAQGKEEEALARRHDLMQQLGTQLMPLYLEMLNKVNEALSTFSNFIAKHPVLAEKAMKGLMAFGAVAVVLGGLSMAFSALSGPIMMVARAVMFLGSVMMANPIFALIAAIAIAAVLIYTYWEPIKQWFASVGIDLTWLEDLVKRSWNRIRQAFDQGLGGILLLMMEWSPIGLVMKACGALLDYLGIQLPDGMVNAGHKLQQSLINLFSWQSIKRHIDEVKAAFGQGLGGILLLIAKWSPIGLVMRACGAVMDYLGIQMPDWLVGAGHKLQQVFIGMFSWQVIGDRLKRFLNAIKEAFNGNLRELGKLIWDWSPVGMLVNKLNDMRREIEALIGADDVGGAIMGTLNVIGNSGIRNMAIDEGKKVATTGSQIASKSVATASQVINIAVNGVGNKDDAQAVGLEVKRQLQNAMDQLKARGRSGMADRG